MLLPVVEKQHPGTGSRVAIGVPVFYGMLIGTAGGLIVIPLLYDLVQTITERYYHTDTAERQTKKEKPMKSKK